MCSFIKPKLFGVVVLVGLVCQSSSWVVAQVDTTEAPAATKPAQEAPVAAEPEQETPPAKPKVKKYEFTIEQSVPATEVKSQGSTGTCWSFATASFIESELMRRNQGQHNLSEMFIVRNIYKDKAFNYVMRQGKANFSQGALAHDFIHSADRHGLVPEEIFSGMEEGQTKHDHSEMEAMIKGILDTVTKRSKPSAKWQVTIDKILDVYLGESPERFTYQDKSYSPKEFADSLGFKGDDYLSITSFSHHPFYEDFVLEIPDNFSNGSFYNVPIDDVIKTIDAAIANGYSVAWDADVSERGFSSSKGIAVLPKNAGRRDLFTTPGEEVAVDQAMRQENFLGFKTTDDHLMHLVGISRDQDGNKYYVIKNSWGEVGPHNGYMHVSEAYVRGKTIAIIVHKDAVPQDVKSK